MLQRFHDRIHDPNLYLYPCILAPAVQLYCISPVTDFILAAISAYSFKSCTVHLTTLCNPDNTYLFGHPCLSSLPKLSVSHSHTRRYQDRYLRTCLSFRRSQEHPVAFQPISLGPAQFIGASTTRNTWQRYVSEPTIFPSQTLP